MDKERDFRKEYSDGWDYEAEGKIFTITGFEKWRDVKVKEIEQLKKENRSVWDSLRESEKVLEKVRAERDELKEQLGEWKYSYKELQEAYRIAVKEGIDRSNQISDERFTFEEIEKVLLKTHEYNYVHRILDEIKKLRG